MSARDQGAVRSCYMNEISMSLDSTRLSQRPHCRLTINEIMSYVDYCL